MEKTMKKSKKSIIKRPSIGIGVIIINLVGKILLGKRKGSHGSGEWSLPGGHLEWFESFEDCCIREVFEETGIQLQGRDFEKVDFTNDLFSKEKKHYVTLFLKIKLDYTPAVTNKEPDKCEKWEWFKPDNLPKPLFTPLKNLLVTKNLV